jgi:hypothetical protein
MVFGRFLLLLPKRSRLQSFFSEKKASELASSKGWTVWGRGYQRSGLWLSRGKGVVAAAAHTWVLLDEALGVDLPQGVEVSESILGLQDWASVSRLLGG